MGRAVLLVALAACAGAPPVPPTPIALAGTCDDQPALPFDRGTTVGLVECTGAEHASTVEPSTKVTDGTWHLVRRRGTTIVSDTTLGSWEHGFEWGGFGELAGVLHATNGDPVAVVVVSEHGGPDMASSELAIYRASGATFTAVYRHANTNLDIVGERATLTDCVPSTTPSPPGPCERYVNQQPRATVLRWTGTAIIATPPP